MAHSADTNISLLIKAKAFELGFDLCGIAQSRNLKERESILTNWCASGMNSGMTYLARNIEKRTNPESLVIGAKSVVVTGLSYYTEKKQALPDVPVISRYAYGENYHDIIKDRLYKLLEYVKSLDPKADGRPFADSAPIMEKAWANEAGLGWQGKHSIVINKEIGSFFFIGVLVLNIALPYDDPYQGENCGSCRLCIDACPTGAINENRTIDARKCIANLNIENRGPVPSELIPGIGRRVYGCDRCQEVCPWNKDAKQHHIPQFDLSEELEFMTVDEWRNLTREQFNRLFGKSEIARKKYEGFMENVTNVTKTIMP